MYLFNQFRTPLFLVALTLIAKSAAAATGREAFTNAITMSPSIFIRQERDQRIGAFADVLRGEDTAHVYLCLNEENLPYTFSLGWFVPAGQNSKSCLDEFGERIPAPGEKPERAGFNKADLAAIRGFDLVSGGKIKAAGKELIVAARLAPRSPRIHNNLGAFYALTDQYGDAQKEFDEALKLKPDYTVALANRAWLALAMKQPQVALADATRALSARKDFRPAALAAARANLELGHADQSAAIADQSAKVGNDPSAMIVAADALVAKGDLKGAQKRYQKALILAPRNPQVLVKAARIEEELGDLDTALKLARTATQVEPKYGEAHLALGHYLELNREYRASQLQYQAALDLDSSPASRKAVSGPLLRVLLSLNRNQEADKLSKKWLAEDQKNADCHYNRAWVASQLAGPDFKTEAIQEYRKALLLKPELVQAHYNIALLLVNKGQPEQAVRELREFIDKSPEDPDVAKAQELLAKLTH